MLKFDIFWTLAKPKNNARLSEHALHPSQPIDYSKQGKFVLSTY